VLKKYLREVAALQDEFEPEYAKYSGLLYELNGKKLASGCVIVPNSQKEKIEKYFKKYNVSFDQIKVWK
jgi:hypothetical protein